MYWETTIYKQTKPQIDSQVQDKKWKESSNNSFIHADRKFTILHDPDDIACPLNKRKGRHYFARNISLYATIKSRRNQLKIL